jgi:hypothetical protein
MTMELVIETVAVLVIVNVLVAVVQYGREYYRKGN